MTLAQALETSFWQNHKIGNVYKMKNRDGSSEFCRIAYFPLEYSDPTALIEIDRGAYNDFREVPIRFLTLYAPKE